MGVGKDYIANNIIIPFLKASNKQCIQLSFADQLKVNSMIKYDLTYENTYVKKTDRTRRLLQHEGTENGRKILGDDIWIQYLDKWYEIYNNRGVEFCVIPDVRYKNEYDYIKSKNGIIIKVVAPSRNETRLNNESNGDSQIYKNIKNHSSETEMDNIDDDYYDIIIKNDGKKLETEQIHIELRKKLKNFL